ncbi:MAG TPA: WhiB family transcriptional regulator [Candidatus Nesterenkonia stercoripullorum]|uniref:WhiB family transcriptional regulator n=1 Tax=Candidatus Nesterenkonia stercoripullorum TaxID=2838701 RepID=A0A9D1RZ87_9MICC|nr:WhiB family transcriptional regulator [Candidatus Nesterenkonia stercoripullorum]
MTDQADHWLESARCVRERIDTEFFFATTPAIIEGVQRVCAQCPVAQRCLALAMSAERHYARYGIFGGLTPQQRRELAKATRS